jgi:tRNA (adenine22-N1)-methyltransferase
MTNEKIILDRRLSAIASLVREGVTLYDVGSDHAYLPAYLLQEEIIPRAVVSDINEGPISRARATLENAGVMDRAQTVLTDGLNGIVLLPPCDVSVAGMGGELISSIIYAKPELKDGRINLILQPMTKPEVLRLYLSSNGYEIQREITVTEGKIYTVILCSYTGKPYSLTEAELYVGVGGAREESDEFYSLVKSKISILRAIADGKRLGGSDVSDEERLISSLETILNERGKK